MCCELVYSIEYQRGKTVRNNHRCSQDEPLNSRLGSQDSVSGPKGGQECEDIDLP